MAITIKSIQGQEMIRALWRKRLAQRKSDKTLLGLKVEDVTKKEETVALSRLGTKKDDDNILDEHIRDVTPSLEVAEEMEESESHSTASALLTPMERRRVERELYEYRFSKQIKTNQLLLTA